MNLDQFTKNGKYLMLAFDHRGSFKKLMNQQNPDTVKDEDVVFLKAEVIIAVQDQFSGILVDESYGLMAYPKHVKPFLLPVEVSGFLEKGDGRINELQHTITELINLGASGAKLLLYFNPNLEVANEQIALAKKVQDECKTLDFPFFLEVVTYSPDDSEDRLSLVLGSLKMLKEHGIEPSVWKLEYAGSQEGCKKVTEIVGNTPWILLTRGDKFEVFKEELKEAISVGCSGFLAGRALWQEVCQLQGEEKETFLKETLPQRFSEISDIVLG